MNDDIHQYDPDSEQMLAFYMHVGRLVHTCTGLEHAVQQLHETLLGTPWWRVTDAEGFEQARQGSLLVSRRVGALAQQTVSDLMREAKDVWDLRGQLVHGHSSPAALTGGSSEAVSITRERRNGASTRVWTLIEIDESNTRAHESWTAVESYYMDLTEDRSWLPSL